MLKCAEFYLEQLKMVFQRDGMANGHHEDSLCLEQFAKNPHFCCQQDDATLAKHFAKVTVISITTLYQIFVNAVQLFLC